MFEAAQGAGRTGVHFHSTMGSADRVASPDSGIRVILTNFPGRKSVVLSPNEAIPKILMKFSLLDSTQQARVQN